MRTLPRLALLALLLPAGCAEDRGKADAMRTVTEFQAALQAGDRSHCRALVTAESATALSAIPWHEVRAKQSLEILGAKRHDSGYLVRVRDPNRDAVEAEFVVVREYGRIVVDLVATAGLTAEFTDHPLATEQFDPRELSPEDHDRIRQTELARPPR